MELNKLLNLNKKLKLKRMIRNINKELLMRLINKDVRNGVLLVRKEILLD